MPDDLAPLVAALSDRDAAARADAARQLAQLGDGAQAAAVPLVRLTTDADEEVRRWVTSALEELGPPSLGDAGALTKLLAGDHADAGFWAATLLGRLGPQAAVAALPLADRLLHSPHLAVRQRSAWALGRLGAAAQPTLDALRQAAASDDPRLARLAQQAIEHIEGE